MQNIKYKFIAISAATLLLSVSACTTNPQTFSGLTQTSQSAAISASAKDPTTSYSVRPPDVTDTQWKISKDQALAIASKFVPTDVAIHAAVSAETGVGGNRSIGGNLVNVYPRWKITYSNILITGDWLGWKADRQTTLVGEGLYNELWVYIDGTTGAFVSREAYLAVLIGGLERDTEPPTATPWTPVPT